MLLQVRTVAQDDKGKKGDEESVLWESFPQQLDPVQLPLTAAHGFQSHWLEECWLSSACSSGRVGTLAGLAGPTEPMTHRSCRFPPHASLKRALTYETDADHLSG